MPLWITPRPARCRDAWAQIADLHSAPRLGRGIVSLITSPSGRCLGAAFAVPGSCLRTAARSWAWLTLAGFHPFSSCRDAVLGSQPHRWPYRAGGWSSSDSVVKEQGLAASLSLALGPRLSDAMER